MRLLESEVYRGKQIRIYIVYPGGFTHSAVPTLGVRIDDQIVNDEPFLQGITKLNEAMEWGRTAVDRLLMGGGGKPTMLPSPV